MSFRLCYVCSSLSKGRSRFWFTEYDRPEFSQDPFVELQPYKRMIEEASKGCQLCCILLNYPKPVEVENEDAMITLRRSPAFPGRAVALCTGPKGRKHITHTFFDRTPQWWWGELLEAHVAYLLTIL